MKNGRNKKIPNYNKIIDKVFTYFFTFDRLSSDILLKSQKSNIKKETSHFGEDN